MPDRRFAISGDLDRQKMIDGVVVDMIVAVELHLQEGDRPDGRQVVHAIVNINWAFGEDAACLGLDLSSGTHAC